MDTPLLGEFKLILYIGLATWVVLEVINYKMDWQYSSFNIT